MSTEVNHAREQAIAKVESIKALMARLEHCEGCAGDSLCPIPFEQQLEELGYMSIFNPEKADEIVDEYHDADKAREAIDESPLSVEVRSGWVNPSELHDSHMEPSEYCLLLCTGGPAVRIIGTLGFYSVPEMARIEYQDWGTPWEELGNTVGLSLTWSEMNELLLSYARQFWYGE